MTAWHSLYLPSDDRERLLAALHGALDALGYILYDPFTHWQPVDSYPRTVKLFVAPACMGWLRVIGEPDPDLLPALSRTAPLLHLALDHDRDHAAFFAEGAQHELVAGLTPYLRPGCTSDDLRRVRLQPQGSAPQDTDHDLLAAATRDLIPGALRSQAGDLNPKQVNRLFSKLMNRVNRAVGSEHTSAARALLGDIPDWQSASGRRLCGLAACLTLPENWHTPDFITLRDAYQRHLRRQQRPDAPLLPGDEATMQQVPDALAYQPIYAGKAD